MSASDHSLLPRQTAQVNGLLVITDRVHSVRWVHAGRVVGEPDKQVSYRDFAATDFELQSAGDFPVGGYSVEVFLDGQSAGTREFRVERPR